MANHPQMQIQVKIKMNDTRSQECSPTIHQTWKNRQMAGMAKEDAYGSAVYNEGNTMERS